MNRKDNIMSYGIFLLLFLILIIYHNNITFLATITAMVFGSSITYLTMIEIEERREKKESRHILGDINQVDLILSRAEKPYKKEKIKIEKIQEKLLPIYFRLPDLFYPRAHEFKKDVAIYFVAFF